MLPFEVAIQRGNGSGQFGLDHHGFGNGIGEVAGDGQTLRARFDEILPRHVLFGQALQHHVHMAAAARMKTAGNGARQPARIIIEIIAHGAHHGGTTFEGVLMKIVNKAGQLHQFRIIGIAQIGLPHGSIGGAGHVFGQ